jgi:ATP-dependent DNA helicase RecG
MIVHRDYRSASDSIVKIFNNKIEFYNPERLPENITVEDLLSNNYKSTPRNKLIADFCKNLGLIEKYGSGIRRIVDYFKSENLPVPEFRNISDGFMVTIFEKEKEDVTEKVTEKRIVIILNEIKLNNKISIDQLAGILKVTRRTILRDLELLKKQNVIKRIGPDKGGHWAVMGKIRQKAKGESKK